MNQSEQFQPFAQFFALSKRNRWIWFLLGFIGTVVIEYIYSFMNTALIAHGFDILDFEFAWNKTRMDTILQGWNPVLTVAINFLLLDMLFPIFYSFMFTGITLLLKDGKKNEPRCAAFGIFLLAAIFDWIENIFSLLILYSPQSYASIYIFLVSAFASLKFACLAIGLVLSFL